jgi:hypothetical protein
VICANQCAGRAAVKRQSRAERQAAAIRLQAEGLSNRAIAEQLGVGKDTVARDLQSAPADTVAAAVRDHARIVTERIDAVWDAQEGSIDTAANASVALQAAALEARTFLQSPGTGSRSRNVAVRVVNYSTGRVVDAYSHEVITEGSGPIPFSTSGGGNVTEQVEPDLAIYIDHRLISPPTRLPGDTPDSYNARCMSCRPPRPECRVNDDWSQPYRDPDDRPDDPAPRR